MSHIKLIPFLNLLGDIAKVLYSSELEFKIENFKKVYWETWKCAMSFASGGSNGKACKKYCNFYNVNSTAPVIEGFKIYFDNIILLIDNFLPVEQKSHKWSNAWMLASVKYWI